MGCKAEQPKILHFLLYLPQIKMPALRLAFCLNIVNEKDAMLLVLVGIFAVDKHIFCDQLGFFELFCQLC